MKIDLPTYDQILELPAVITRTVPQEFIDENGHMNISDYFRVASQAVWADTTEAGVDPAYIAGEHMSLFTVEQHLRYHGELRLDERFSVHTRFLARSARVVHRHRLRGRSRQGTPGRHDGDLVRPCEHRLPIHGRHAAARHRRARRAHRQE